VSRHHEEEDLWDKLLRKVIRLVDLVIARLESETATNASLTIQGEPMANYPLNAGDSVVVTLTVTDDVTGAVVVPDAGSVTAVLSDATDSVVDNGDGTFTLTAGAGLSTGNTLTVNGTVGGVSFGPVGGVVGTYDVDADVVTPDSTTATLTFGTETAPVGTPPVVAADPSIAGLSEAQVAAGFRNS
jgi:hypothetical protein